MSTKKSYILDFLPFRRGAHLRGVKGGGGRGGVSRALIKKNAKLVLVNISFSRLKVKA